MPFIIHMLPVIGSMFVFKAVHALVAPKRETGPIVTTFVEASGGLQGGGIAGLNPSGGLVERIDYWLVQNLKLEPVLDNLHMMLGRPEKPTPLQILHTKELAVLGAAVFLYMLVGAFAVVLAPVAFVIPDMLLKSKVGNRQMEILGNFPQFVDLTALMVESGTDYMTAFDRIVKVTRKKGDLELEIEKTIAEVSLGGTRKDALRHLADRVGVQEIRSFVGLIVQSEELGTSLVNLLREFAADMRFRRLNKAEKLAAQAATKMLIPIFIFILPTVFVLILAPMAWDMVMGGGMFG